MRNLKVMTAYRGTKYHGFQRQNNALTVQEVLERCVSKVLNEQVTITGCSRTDTGVHANQFCFNVHTNSSIKCLGFTRGVNGELPDDISILSCEDAPEDFHARFNCVGKEYVYKIHCSESKNPFASDLMFHYRRPFDLEAVKKAARYFVGEHDFASFCADCSNLSTTVRTIYSLEIENNGDSVTSVFHLMTSPLSLRQKTALKPAELLWLTDFTSTESSIQKMNFSAVITDLESKGQQKRKGVVNGAQYV